MYLRRLRHVLSTARNAWIDDHAQSMGAALSYYTEFTWACAHASGSRQGQVAEPLPGGAQARRSPARFR